MVSRHFEQCKGVGTVVPILLFSGIPKTSHADILMQIDPGARRSVRTFRTVTLYSAALHRAAAARRLVASA